VTALLSAVSSRAIINYPVDFLPVTITSINSGLYTSSNGNGIITVTNTGGAFEASNSMLYLSQFTNLFPSNGTVQGWLSVAANNAVYTNTFYLDNYTLSSNTIFGFWNPTEETNTYHLQLIDSNNSLISPPFNWNFIGYDDDFLSGDVAWYHINLNTNTGYFNPTNYTSNGPHIDCDGAFWNKIPTNTARIVLIGTLNATNHDGIVFYFAEQRVPCAIRCPADVTVTICGPPGTNVTYPTPIVYGDCGTNLTAFCDPGSGSFFKLGTNLVMCHVPGESNLTCSFNVIVLNSEPIPPVIFCPSNMVIYTCNSNAVATYNVTATNSTGDVTTNISMSSGSTFPLGTNTVYCSATDGCSNVTSCQFDVIVLPYPPLWGVVCPNETYTTNVTGCPPIMPDLTNLVTITNQCAIPGGLAFTQSPPVGAVLTPTNHQVTITVCDTNGTCHSCLFSVNAFFSGGCCAIACPSNITAITCGSSEVVTFATPIVIGPCASNATVVCAPPSGSIFPLGTNTVTCTATNSSGTVVASCSFNIIVTPFAIANGFDFLPVTITGAGAQFTSTNGNGFITVTNTGGPFLSLNNTLWSSQFTNLFPASGTVPGWLARADNNAKYTNIFYLTNYALSASLVFGMWNITEEPNTYSIKLLDATNNLISPPFSWNFLGYDDDSLSGNIAWYHMNLNYASGFFSPTNYKASGIDCDGAFWDNIPVNTRKIVVTGTLGAFNADGVVFYFAERVGCVQINCPGSIAVGTCGTNAIVNFPTPFVTGTAASSAVMACVPPSGSKFPLGVTTVNCTVTDTNGTFLDTCSFTVTVAPSLLCATTVTIGVIGANIICSWPDSFNGFQLQETLSLNPPIQWSNVEAPVVSTNSTFRVTIPIQPDVRFYRLSN
jgi:hypothetical protein